MPLDTLSPSSLVTPNRLEATPTPKPTPVQQCLEAVQTVHTALDAHLAAPAGASEWADFVRALHCAAAVVATLSRGTTDETLRAGLVKLVQAVVVSGVHERLAAEDSAPVPEAKGWPGLISVMLLRPAWWISRSPEFDRVPDWLMVPCSEWLFAVPQAFAASGQADRYALHCERQLAELVSGMERNPGALAVRTALEQYQSHSNSVCLRLSSHDLRRHAELHARLVTRLARTRVSFPAPVAIAREGRRLRVGFIVPEFDGSTEMRATMPLLSNLDPERFETEVFVSRSTETRWETAARQTAMQVQALPQEFSEQAAMIANSMLDVLVFCGELAGTNGDLAKLATVRMAPLQVATSAHQTCTTGFANIDLLAVGSLTGIENDTPPFAERLGLIPGPARAFDFVTGSQAPEVQLTRADVGIPANALVFVAAADWAQMTPETHASWARLLSAVPGSFLLLQRIGFDATDSTVVARHCAAIDRTLAAAGVADNRLVVLSAASGSQTELEAVLSLGDVYLDSQPTGDDVAALAALKRGVPVVTLPGSHLRSRRVAALLRSIGCAELIAENPEAFHGLAARLASSLEERGALAERIRTVMACGPWPFDGLATGDAFGDLLEVAFDEMLSAGAAFRSGSALLQVHADSVSTEEHLRNGVDALAQGDALVAAAEARLVLRTQPTHAGARALMGRALLALGQAARAVDYLIPAVEAPDADAACWFSLAQALQQNGQSREAVQALQTSLQLDPSRAESWLMLIELAEGAGMLDLAKDAFNQLKQHAPAHADIESIAARLGDGSISSPDD